jgi:hypothetical protein
MRNAECGTEDDQMHSASLASSPLEERLERGELVLFPDCPFPLPTDDDRAFLSGQQLASRSHKNISLDPHTGRTAGYRRTSAGQGDRLRRILADFSRTAGVWLGSVLPRYAADWQPDRATFRPEEEATRPLRLTARNDLLHIDAFPTRPARGRRLLRLYVNLNPTEPRVWATSETWPALLRRFRQAGHDPLRWLPASRDWAAPLGGFWPANRHGRSAYDACLLRLHHFLKADEAFQERGVKRFWSFPPGSAWLLFADGLSHAVLRGRFALEHSFFVPRDAWSCPEEAPLTHLEQLSMPGRRAA